MWSILVGAAVKAAKNPVVRSITVAVLKAVIDDLMRRSKNKKR